MHVIHLNCHRDPSQRPAAELLSAWRTLLDVATAVSNEGIRVSLVQTSFRDEEFQRNGIRCFFIREGTSRLHLPSVRGVDLCLPRRVAQQILSLDADLIHFHGLSFPIQLRYLHKKLPNVPVLVQDHANRPPKNRWKRSLHRWGLAKVAGAAFNGQGVARPFQQTRLLRAGVPVFEVLESSSWFTPSNRDHAKATTGMYGDPCLLWIGHLNANKDPLTVLNALRFASTELPSAHLWCYFIRAPLLTSVRELLAADPHLAARVHLMGAVNHDEIEMLYRAADFLLLGSHREGSGYAVLEALACGTTPLLTDIPSFRFLTGNGSCGAISPPGDARAMANALVKWSRFDRDEVRRRSRAHFERSLSFEILGRQLRRAYESLAQ